MLVTRRQVFTAGIVLFLASPCFPAKNYGLWKVEEGVSSIYAFTTNDSGALLGQFCEYDSGLCKWMLGTNISCVEEENYPVLANSSTGAYHFDVTCIGLLPGYSTIYAYAFSEPEKLNKAIRAGVKIGIAFPLENDNFRVSRFVLTGANKSLDVMYEAFKQRITVNPSGAGTRDYEF